MAAILDNCPAINAEEMCTSHEASCLPTAKEHANQLASIFNSPSAAVNRQTTTVDNDGQVELNNTQPSQPTTNTTCSVNYKAKKMITTTAIAPAKVIQIGSGGELFQVKISIEKCHDLFKLLLASGDTIESQTKAIWISYRYQNTVVQSEMFTTIDDFVPMMNSFHIRSSVNELFNHFHEKKSSLKIHICIEGEVLGTTYVDLRKLLISSQDFDSRMVQQECRVESRNGEEDCCPCISVQLCIDRDPMSYGIIGEAGEPLNKELQHQSSKRVVVDRASSPMRHAAIDEHPGNDCDGRAEKLFDKRKRLLNAKEAELSKKEKELYEAVSSLEKKRCEWEQWRHRQELEWHEKLRGKEAAMMRVVEERVCSIEKETRSSKTEYEKLESRLRKALIEVEAKERQLKDIELGYLNERNRKIAELESKEKIMKEELKHTIEIERAKVNAAVEAAVLAEKAAAAANEKVKRMEDEVRKTPEITLMHQMAELKGQLADTERRMEVMRVEKNQVTAEKEQFRSNVHKLAKALRQERDKAITKRESSNQQVRLSYDPNEKSFILGGEQDEVQRILSDLNKMSQIREQSSALGGHTNVPIFFQ